MPDQLIVVCKDCRHVYAARRRADGSFILPTRTGYCRCGGTAFSEYAGFEGVIPRPS